MRIIDKQHDFYDYLQDPTDRIVFDRRGSFLLTKERFCDGIKLQRYHNNNYTNEQVRLSGLQTTYSYRKTELGLHDMGA